MIDGERPTDLTSTRWIACCVDSPLRGATHEPKNAPFAGKSEAGGPLAAADAVPRGSNVARSMMMAAKPTNDALTRCSRTE